jgi:hypothetical protein
VTQLSPKRSSLYSRIEATLLLKQIAPSSGPRGAYDGDARRNANSPSINMNGLPNPPITPFPQQTGQPSLCRSYPSMGVKLAEAKGTKQRLGH